MRDIGLPLSKPVLWLMGLFLLSAGISFLLSEYTYLSFRGYVKWWKAFLLFIIACETLRDKKRAKTFLRISLIMLAVAALDGLFQLVIGRDFLRWHTPNITHYGTMIRAGFGHYNNYSAYLATLIPVAIAVTFEQPQRGRLMQLLSNISAIIS